MEPQRNKNFFCRWGMLMISIGCVVAFAAPIVAQTAGDPAKAQMQEMNRREMQLSSLGEKGRPNDPKRTQAMMDQVSEDFQRILTRHNEIVRAIAANQSLSYQFISDATGEIKKRSTRLQSSLRLQKPETSTEDRETGSVLIIGMETKDEMILLCKQIESVVKNPIIEKPGTVDAQELDKARNNLQRIVELSDAIKKQADKRIH